jgi:hypothetical protein
MHNGSPSDPAGVEPTVTRWRPNFPVLSTLSGPKAVGVLLQASHVGRVDVEATVSGLDASLVDSLGEEHSTVAEA